MASIYNERYTIGLTVEEKDLDVSPINYSFIIKDSINSLFPTAFITFRDITGQFNEYLTFIDGVKIKINFGNTKSSINCPFVVMRNSTPEQITPTNAGGIIEIPLIHEYYYNQSKKSLAFNDEISSIVKKKASSFNFNSIDIDSTLNKGLWYQPYITDADFIVNLLLPFSFSNDANSSPYYCFIDINNDFYYKSYKKLYIDAKSIQTLNLVQNATIETLSDNSIYSFNSTQPAIKDIRDNLHRILFDFDSSNSYEDVQDYVYDYPTSQSEKRYIPITWSMDNITYVGELLCDDGNIENTKNNNKGLQNNSMKKIYSLDRVIVMTNVNTNLRSGKKITINVPTGTDSSKTESSSRYSDDYLIETAYQKWTGSLGKTILVCSKKNIKLPDNYSRRSILIKK